MNFFSNDFLKIEKKGKKRHIFDRTGRVKYTLVVLLIVYDYSILSVM